VEFSPQDSNVGTYIDWKIIPNWNWIRPILWLIGYETYFNFFCSADADPIRLQTEVRILLLHLIHHFPIIPTLPYDGQWRNLYGKSTVANKLEFEIFSRFVTAFRKQDYLEVWQFFHLWIITVIQASQIYITELNRLLDEKARKLCSRLLPLLDNSPSKLV
jgi:hypothetical protein